MPRLRPLATDAKTKCTILSSRSTPRSSTLASQRTSNVLWVLLNSSPVQRSAPSTWLLSTTMQTVSTFTHISPSSTTMS